MRVDVFNRYQAENLEPSTNSVVISISAPGNPAKLAEGWEDILRLEFDDVVRIPKGFNDIVAFSREHVSAIYEFVGQHKDKNFVVHCDAGMSRSVAVGVYLRDVYGGELHTHATNTTEAANSRVLRGLMRDYWKETFSKDT